MPEKKSRFQLAAESQRRNDAWIRGRFGEDYLANKIEESKILALRFPESHNLTVLELVHKLSQRRRNGFPFAFYEAQAISPPVIVFRRAFPQKQLIKGLNDYGIPFEELAVKRIGEFTDEEIANLSPGFLWKKKYFVYLNRVAK